MSNFTQLYKSINPDRSPEQTICENPLLAITSGTPINEVIEALRGDGWPEDEIAKLIEHADEAMHAI
jgi:hypothetical protein